MKVQIIVPRKLPSLNELLRMHWADKNTLQCQWRNDIYHLLGHKNVKLLQAHRDLKHRCKITIHSERTGKRWQLDEDNLIGGSKLIVDALKDYIVDDSSKWLDREVTQAKSTTAQTIITLQTLEASNG